MSILLSALLFHKRGGTHCSRYPAAVEQDQWIGLLDASKWSELLDVHLIIGQKSNPRFDIVTADLKDVTGIR